MPGERGRSPSFNGRMTVSSTWAAPQVTSIISGVTPPGRSMRGTAPVTSITVDSRPTRQGPPSNISGMRPFMSSHTCFAVVGLGRPERLALGAATGRAAASISARASGWAGKRTATVESPAVTSGGTRSDLGKISVIGPGHHASISAFAMGEGAPATRGASCCNALMCTISGLSPGRPLASKMRFTASAFSASAPRP